MGVIWQAFEKALKAQFEPLSKEERAREQIRKLVQTGNVNTYIYRFCEVKNEILFDEFGRGLQLVYSWAQSSIARTCRNNCHLR